MIPRAVVRLLRFHKSPDAELPECVCSLCGRVFYTDPGLEIDGHEVDSFDGVEIPIRLFSDGGWEMRFHPGCFEQVFAFERELRQQALDGSTPGYFDVRPGLRVEFAWGDDETGKLVAT